MRALVVEDDESVAKLLQRILSEEGFAVDTVGSGNEGSTLAMVNPYDAIVLDLGLPDRNGVTIVQYLRKEGRTVPILILTGAADTETMVRALDAGADDYVTKPVDVQQLKARMRALVRRGGAQRTEELTFGNLLLNRLSRQVLVDGREMRLTPKEFTLLEQLLLNAGIVVTRSELLEKVWDMHFDPATNVVDVNVTRVRRKLDEMGASVAIVARRGVGFVIESK